MIVEWDVEILMSDGVVLRADIFRPVGDDAVPAILSYGPYGKGLSFQVGYKTAWDMLLRDHPEVAVGSSTRYQNWEVVDPEKWVPDGYACVRIDSRGSGNSPGYSNQHTPRETDDICEAITWVSACPWCSGHVGMNGVSYYAMNAWRVAARNPPQLKAICAWEGSADRYRDASHHGGILSTFVKNWHEMQVKTMQYGLGERGPRHVITGALACGNETLSDEQLKKNRVDLWQEFLDNPLDGPYYHERSPDLGSIVIPFLSAANWGGQGLHLRGNVEAFTHSRSAHKWLEIHGGAHWAEFYSDYGVQLQKRFFGYFLKGEPNGWDQQPPIQLRIRHVDRFVTRHEKEWPIERTRWTKFYLHPESFGLLPSPRIGKSNPISYSPLADGVTFMSPELEAEMEITGPSVLKLNLSSESEDADVFAVLRVFDPDGHEVVFQGALDPHTPIGQGWLRASHRKLDPHRSLAYRPFHSHDEIQKLTPGVPVSLDVEIWPTSIVVPVRYRVGITVLGKDYEWQGPSSTLSNMKNPMKGCGPFVHDEPTDRPADVFGAPCTLHFDDNETGYILLPIIPADT